MKDLINLGLSGSEGRGSEGIGRSHILAVRGARDVNGREIRVGT